MAASALGLVYTGIKRPSLSATGTLIEVGSNLDNISLANFSPTSVELKFA